MAGIPSVQLDLDRFALDTTGRRFSAGKCLVDIFLHRSKMRERKLVDRLIFLETDVWWNVTAVVGGCVDDVNR